MKKIFLTAFVMLMLMPVVGQDARYKLLKQEWVVKADGTSDYHYRHEVQILRNRALTAYADKGETFVVYNPDLEELVVNEVYTIQKDGTRVNMPQNAFVYQLPSQCVDCGRMAHMRELAMIHTGMELGCTIVVDYTIHRKYNLINETIELVKDCPVDRWEVSVNVPEGQDFHATLSDPKILETNPVEYKADNVYRLTLTNVPRQFVDNYLPSRESLYPMLHFFNGVPEFHPAFDRNGLSEADGLLSQLPKGSDARDRIRTISNYVVDNIHLNDIAPKHLGYNHASALQVWQSGCGTATDKAVLLAALLNQADFQAQVVGDNGDEVGVMIDTLEYRIGVRHRNQMTLYGEARDEVRQVRIGADQKKNVIATPTFDTLEDGFYRMHFEPIKGVNLYSAGNLAISRQAPLQGTPCDVECSQVYNVAGMKMVDKEIQICRSYEGVGEVSVCVKQKGKKVYVDKKLKLEQSIVPVEDYAKFRELLVLWQNKSDLLFKKK